MQLVPLQSGLQRLNTPSGAAWEKMLITKRGVFLLLDIFSDVFWRQGISIAEKLIESMNPRFRFIMVVIIIYLFVLDDLLVSYRAATRTEQLTKCCMNHCRSRGVVGYTLNRFKSPVILQLLSHYCEHYVAYTPPYVAYTWLPRFAMYMSHIRRTYESNIAGTPLIRTVYS